NLGDLYRHTTLDRNSKDPVQVIVEDVFAVGCTDKAVQITPDQWGGIRTIGGNANEFGGRGSSGHEHDEAVARSGITLKVCNLQVRKKGSPTAVGFETP